MTSKRVSAPFDLMKELDSDDRDKLFFIVSPPIGCFTSGSSAPHGVSTTGYVPVCVVEVCVAEVSVANRVGVAGDEWPTHYTHPCATP